MGVQDEQEGTEHWALGDSGVEHYSGESVINTWGTLSIHFYGIWTPSITDINTKSAISPHLTWVLCLVHRSSAITWSGMLWRSQFSAKIYERQSLISCCLVNLISCILFPCNWALCRRRLSGEIALGPSWVSLAHIPALFPLFLWRLYQLQWPLVQLAGWSENAVGVIVSRFAKSSPSCASFPKLKSVFLSRYTCFGNKDKKVKEIKTKILQSWRVLCWRATSATHHVIRWCQASHIGFCCTQAYKDSKNFSKNSCDV